MKNCPRCQLAVGSDVQRCPRCASAVHTTDAPQLVDGRYAIEAELGHGAMGVVYLARDVGLARKVALKFIAPEFVREPVIVERFRHEAQALAQIRHENVVEVHAFGQHGATYFFAMEYVVGQNLDAILAAHAANATLLPVPLVVGILGRVARGLGAVHAAGLVHRDVKPGNIVIEQRTGRPVLIDLGIAKPVGAGAARQTAVVGSPPYMAPEQIVPPRDGAGITAAADVYALGCTAYELLTGRLPFEGASGFETMHLHLNAPPPPVSAARPECAPLDRVLATAMAKHPGERHASALAFAADLERAAAATRDTVLAAPAPPPGPARQPGVVRVLIVDDDRAFRVLVAHVARAAFPNQRIDVAFAETGDEALERARAARPDVVCLDYDMPGMNGVETLALLRGLPGLAAVPAIVVTGYDEARVRWRFGILGVTELLTKPMPPRDLAAAFQWSLPDAAPPGG